ncbi:MAG: coproporphyrinogen III oxidase [Gemmatimonadales bacterium]|nr:MAG: coproporphyrinogen III oxidase [Gemmatimonadales bacterium]
MRHIYIHVPFCRRRCSYCDFAIAVRKAIPAARFVAAIRREHELRRRLGEWDGESLETLYLGGGTPSLLDPQAVADLVRHFTGEAGGATRPQESDLEITLEANPEDVTREAARAWVACGINRVSLGVQSFHPGVLRWMHRSHGPEAPARAVKLLRRAGVRSISLDLIFALPESLEHDFRSDLEAAVALEPDHLSIYGLSVEPRTPLSRWISRGAIAPPREERYAEEFLLAHEYLTARGFDHYEVSNYARPGFRARHNSAYWRGEPYAGLGPAAHRYQLTRSGEWMRAWNVDQWAAYEPLVAAGTDPTAAREILTTEKRALEAVYLGLRTSEGISPADPLIRAALDEGPLLKLAISKGWLRNGGNRLVPSAEGWLRLDQLVVSLTTSAGGG